MIRKNKSLPKRSKLARESGLKKIIFGETIFSSNIGGKRVTIKKKPLLLSLIFGHDVKVDNRAHSSLYIYDEGENLRIILANHKGRDLHLIPSIAESLAHKLKKKRVFVEVSDSEVEKHLENKGFVLHSNLSISPQPGEDKLIPDIKLTSNIYVKDLNLPKRYLRKK